MGRLEGIMALTYTPLKADYSLNEDAVRREIDWVIQKGATGIWPGYGPVGMPEEVKKVLIPAIEKAAKNPESKARLEKMHFIVDYRPPSEQRRLAAEEYETALGIARKIGLYSKKPE